MKDLYINGKAPVPSFHPAWYITDSYPLEITTLSRGKTKNYRYVLKDNIDTTLIDTSKLKKEYPRSDVSMMDDYGDWIIIDNDFKLVYSFYELIYDTEEPKHTPVDDVELIDVATVSKVDKVAYDAYQICDENNKHKYKSLDISNAIKNYLVDEMSVPSLLLHERPCEISGDDLYKIVRAYIKQNINFDYADITSDYAFCFTVKKRVRPPSKPSDDMQQLLTKQGRMYNVPKCKDVEPREVQYTIFEMTPPSNRYENYPIINGIKGDNHQDLQDNIRKYCEDLINNINKPTQLCECCNGTGVEQIPLNITNSNKS